MLLAIASGKGGTGKTTLATNLAWIATQEGCGVTYMDCDVDEPNGHIFLRPEGVREQSIDKLLPHVDADRCSLCGDCGAFCQYAAIVCAGKSVVVFPETCHACGGCALVCPTGAVEQQAYSIGKTRIGSSGLIRFVDGMLHVGQHMGPPAIRAVKNVGRTGGTMHAPSRQPLAQSAIGRFGPTDRRATASTASEGCAAASRSLQIIDAPPGTSCSMVEAVRDSDLVVLVTEPTPFGVHDLQLAIETVLQLELPLGVIINRAGLDDQSVHACCRQAAVPVLGELPDDRAVAEAYSRGELACEAVAGYGQRIKQILARILSFSDASCANWS